MNEVVVNARRVVTGAKQRHHGTTPSRDPLDTEGRHRRVGLEPDVPHADERTGGGRENDRDHDALEIERIAYVRRSLRDIRRRVEQRVEHLEDGFEFLETATLGEQRFELVEEVPE